MPHVPQARVVSYAECVAERRRISVMLDGCARRGRGPGRVLLSARDRVRYADALMARLWMVDVRMWEWELADGRIGSGLIAGPSGSGMEQEEDR